MKYIFCLFSKSPLVRIYDLKLLPGVGQLRGRRCFDSYSCSLSLKNSLNNCWTHVETNTYWVILDRFPVSPVPVIWHSFIIIFVINVNDNNRPRIQNSKIEAPLLVKKIVYKDLFLIANSCVQFGLCDAYRV